MEEGVLYPLVAYLLSIRQEHISRTIEETQDGDVYTYHLTAGSHVTTSIVFNEANRLRYEAKAADAHTRH